MSLALGVEIGGTKLQAGAGLKNKKLVAVARRRVDPAKGAEGILAALPALIREARGRRKISAIGVGFGGPVDASRGVTLVSHQVEGWTNFPLKRWLERQCGLPVVLQNDCKAAAFGEATLGAGVGKKRIFYVTIGSGIGGGFVVDGRVDIGQGLGAGEIGHTWVPHPRTGEPEKLEEICSGWSIGRRAQALGLGASAETVYAAAEKGDEAALSLLDETCRTLALAISNAIALVHPERIIIGGGVSHMGPLFWGALRAHLKKFIFKPFSKSVAIVPAALGEEVVVVGAVLLGLEKIR